MKTMKGFLQETRCSVGIESRQEGWEVLEEKVEGWENRDQQEGPAATCSATPSRPA